MQQQPRFRRRRPTAPRLDAPRTPVPRLPAGHHLAVPRPPRDPEALVVMSINVAGLASTLRKDQRALCRIVAAEGADVLCIQEHKLQVHKTGGARRRILGIGGMGVVKGDGAREIFGDNCRGAAGGGGRPGPNKLGLPGWHITYACSTKAPFIGHSGVAIASRVSFFLYLSSDFFQS